MLVAALHFFEDCLASNLNTLLYPVTIIDNVLGLSWLYSHQFNIAMDLLYLLILVFREELLKQKGFASWLKPSLALIGVLSFAVPKAVKTLFGFKNLVAVELDRFLGVAALILKHFLPSRQFSRHT
jgi:hypothetical protein